MRSAVDSERPRPRRGPGPEAKHRPVWPPCWGQMGAFCGARTSEYPGLSTSTVRNLSARGTREKTVQPINGSNCNQEKGTT